MNTPAHVVLSGLLLGRARWRRHWLPVTAGALLPDLPMVGFYLYQRLALSVPERVIWSHAYFDPDWQAFFDLFNSLPLIGLLAFVAWRLRSPAGLALLASMAVHCLADLPLHREDAHAHFYPLTTWRFQSPVSYWDPRYGGLVVAGLEAVLVVGGSLVLVRRSRPWRLVGLVTLGLYVAFGAFAYATWVG